MITKFRRSPTAALLARRWWSEPVEYSIQVAYFARRGILGSLQLLVATSTFVLALIPAAIGLSPAGAHDVKTTVVLWAVSVSALVVSSLWWCGRWPSRGWSGAFVVYADAAISTVVLVNPHPLAGLLATNALVLVSVYAIFFEGPRTLVAHTLWALTVSGVLAARMSVSPSADGLFAMTTTVTAFLSLVVVPSVVQFVVWMLRNDANDSLTDQLTGLYNRRGLNLLMDGLLRGLHAERSDSSDAVMVLVIDIDCFKRINDTYGHAEGDAALMRTAQRIREAVRASALVARSGGEEFVVADLTSRDSILTIAERVRCAIAEPGTPADLTASIGVTTMDLDDLADPATDPIAALNRAIDRADHAMFEAKHNGGNAVAFRPMTPHPGYRQSYPPL